MSALGATDSVNSALTSGTSSLGISPPSAPRDLEIPFVQVLLPKTKYRLHPVDSTIAPFLALFESVTFLALEFSVEITGQNGRLQFAATGLAVSPSSDTAWLGAPVYQRFAGNAQGDTFATYSFPSSHPFGVELKAVSLGNPYPRFYFRFDGGTGDSASIRGKLVVRGGGRGILSAVQLVSLDTGKSSTDRDSAIGV